VPLVEDVAQRNVTAQFAISNQGALVYIPSDAIGGPRGTQRTLVWVDRQGGENPIKGVSPRAYLYPRLSPDGARVLLEVRGQQSDIWILDLARERLTPLTLGPTFEQYGVWADGGKTVIYASSRLGVPRAPRSLFRRPSDGTGTPEQLMDGTVAQFPSTVTSDGNVIFRAETPPAKVGIPPGSDLNLLPKGERRSRPLLAEKTYDELNAEVSPNGKWLAYESNETGQLEIYVRPFPNVDDMRFPVSNIIGGTQPLWARNGQELFFESMGRLMRVPVKTGSIFEYGTPEKLFDAPYILRPQGGGLGRTYDVSLDGQRFLMIKESSTADERPPSPRIVLVQNWFDELKRLVPTK
jgi:hypothetical protein